MLAVPAVICLVANLLVPSAVFWSLYVIGALVVGWTFCVSPFLFKKYFPLLWIVANTVATLGYLYPHTIPFAGAVAGSSRWRCPSCWAWRCCPWPCLC